MVVVIGGQFKEVDEEPGEHVEEGTVTVKRFGHLKVKGTC